MKIMTIASGSSGNSTYIGTSGKNILIDTGISGTRIESGLKNLGLSVSDLDGIFITHEHTDHVSGLGVLLRKYEVPVYLTEGTYEAVCRDRALGNMPQEAFNIIKCDAPFKFGDLTVNPIHTSHDASDPVVYRFDEGEKSFAIVTDTGKICDGLCEKLCGLDAILLEANHDIRMLQVGPYPYALKQRILGSSGHLSNEAAGQLAVRLCSEKLKYIILGHLSKTNNYDELAREAVRMELEFEKKTIPEILVAPRSKISDIIEI